MNKVKISITFASFSLPPTSSLSLRHYWIPVEPAVGGAGVRSGSAMFECECMHLGRGTRLHQSKTSLACIRKLRVFLVFWDQYAFRTKIFVTKLMYGEDLY